MANFWVVLISIVVALIFLKGIRVIRPTEKGLVETFGKYTKFTNPGFNWVFPVIQRLTKVNTTEQMYEIDKQEIITEDNLNANVDLVIFYKVRKDEESVKRSVYEVSDFEQQITVLAQTTARNVIGGMLFKAVNSKRNDLNLELAKILKKETAEWGVDIVRVELRDITPPEDVQDTMNTVIKAENEKRAAVDFATAMETQADGKRRAAIKEAEGIKQAKILEAEGNAQAIKIVNEAADKYFKGNAQTLRKLEAVEKSISTNTKIIVPDNSQLVNLIGDLAGIAKSK